MRQPDYNFLREYAQEMDEPMSKSLVRALTLLRETYNMHPNDYLAIVKADGSIERIKLL